jgi:hypothetical protein
MDAMALVLSQPCNVVSTLDKICTCMPTSQTDACILCFSSPLAAGVDITAQLSGVIGLAYLQCTAANLMHRRKGCREQQYLCDRS